MHQLTVSVVVPCYNGERFVGEAIESALAGMHAPAQVIVADDESADGIRYGWLPGSARACA